VYIERKGHHRLWLSPPHPSTNVATIPYRASMTLMAASQSPPTLAVFQPKRALLRTSLLLWIPSPRWPAL
jgi:hypothetical protein